MYRQGDHIVYGSHGLCEITEIGSSPIDPKPGCRFAVRCNYATPACFERDPELREYCPGHFVACHNVEAANN